MSPYYEVILEVASGARRAFPWSKGTHGRATRANLALFVEGAQRRTVHTIVRADLYCNRSNVTVATWTRDTTKAA